MISHRNLAFTTTAKGTWVSFAIEAKLLSYPWLIERAQQSWASGQWAVRAPCHRHDALICFAEPGIARQRSLNPKERLRRTKWRGRRRRRELCARKGLVALEYFTIRYIRLQRSVMRHFSRKESKLSSKRVMPPTRSNTQRQMKSTIASESRRS